MKKKTLAKKSGPKKSKAPENFAVTAADAAAAAAAAAGDASALPS
jgi:hypothetical protein